MNKYYFSKWSLFGKTALVALFLSASFTIFAQTHNVAMNKAGNRSTNPAILDLSDASNRHLGFLMPNVSLVSTTDVATIPSPATGLIVWNTNAAMPFGTGFYYWSGSQWYAVASAGSSSLSGSGTANYIARWTSASALGTGVAQDNGSGVSISSTALTPANMLDVKGSAAFGTYAGTAAPANGLIASGQVGIGTNAPNASAALDVTSSSQGLLFPRMPGTSITSISSPATGLIVFNTTTSCLEYYNGSTWQNMECPCTGVPNAGAITGNIAPCQSTAGYTYSITALASGTNYSWTVPSGASITAGAGTNSITVTMGTSSGNVTVTASNSCGTGPASRLTVNPVAPISAPATPSGTATPTISNTFVYTIPAVAGALSYNWSVSGTDATIVSGQGSNTVSISFDATPVTINICVYDSNACGVSSPSCLSVTSTACLITHGTYSQSGTGAYTWTVPCGITTVTINLTGAGGGIAYGGGVAGTAGNGASVNCNLAVTASSVLNIYLGDVGQSPTSSTDLVLGGNGGNGGDESGGNGFGGTYTSWALGPGYGAGGGGGGASSIRVGGTSLGNRIIVAGGGGGASVTWAGGGGGQPALAGTGDDICTGASPGTSGVGGAAFICFDNACTLNSSSGPESPVAPTGGGLGTGGNGGMALDNNCDNYGGGGGGGGAGGGAGGCGGGGGGGYSYTGGAGVSAVSVTANSNSGAGSITITY